MSEALLQVQSFVLSQKTYEIVPPITKQSKDIV